MKRAFTLIELLTVMAITAVLMSIITVPLVQSFNMTRTAQAFADAQDRARVITERIAQEIGTAVSVRSSSTQVITTLNGVATKLPANSLIVVVPGKDGTPTEIAMPYSMLDIVLPAEGNPTIGPNGGYINPVTGDEDPTMAAPKGQVQIPVVPGQTVVRFFMARRDPFKEYNNPYDGRLMAKNGNQDNLYVLFRAEVQPVLADGTVNSEFFDTDANGKPVLDDPHFFEPSRDAMGNIITNDVKADRIRNWLGLGASNTILGANSTRRAIVMTEGSRYDMIQPVYSLSTQTVTYDGNVPRMVALLQFRPSHVDNETAAGQVAYRQGDESGNSASVAPSMYKTSHGSWDHAVVRDWPAGWDPSLAATNAYNVGRGDPRNGEPGFPPGFSVYYYDPDSSPNDFTGGLETFDGYTYAYRSALPGSPVGSIGIYPFSEAVTAANSRSSWLSSLDARNTFVPFALYPSTGKIRTDFSISEVGTPGSLVQAADPRNLPQVDTSATDPYTPFTDPDLTGNFYDPKFDSINEKFNKAWVTATNFQPNQQRFIDLRVTPNFDGSMTPLNPVTGFARCSVVPGSEEVYGPDQLPGDHYGLPIRYTRTTKEPGPNQYRINYTDIQEPDYTLLGLTAAQLAGFNPNVYDSTNFVSAVIQPRFKKGYIQLNSDPNAALPAGQFQVAYRFQFNGAGSKTGAREDVFAVDYDTRQLMDVLLTLANYPQTGLLSVPNPQTVTLKSTAAVRNYVR